jgi:L-lactate dehydrogenase complex protein LldG
MTDQARSEIFARVRHASHRAGAGDIRNEHFRLGRSPVAQRHSADLNIEFLANVLGNYGSIAVTRNRSETAKQIGSYLFDKYRSRKLLVGGDPRLAAMPWRDGGLLPRFGTAEDGDLAAVSYAQMAVAETGSIVSFTGKANPAANNLLVEDHIVIVDTADLVATLDDLWARVEELPAREQRPRGINIISGPSSTADIEMHLVKGAHGPRSWHVILQGDLTENLADRAREIAGSAFSPD